LWEKHARELRDIRASVEFTHLRYNVFLLTFFLLTTQERFWGSISNSNRDEW